MHLVCGPNPMSYRENLLSNLPRLVQSALNIDGSVRIHRCNRTNYRYKRSSRSSTSFGFSAFFPFALLPSFSKIHSHPRSQRFLIWFLVPMDPGILSRPSTTAFASSTTAWRFLTDRSSWNFEAGESFFRSAIVFWRSLLQGSLDLDTIFNQRCRTYTV